MSENQPSENDRQQRLVELQARLQKLTEERKAELRRSGPLPGDVSPRSADEGAQEPAVETPAPSMEAAPKAAAAPPSEPLPVLQTPPPMRAPEDQPVAAATTPPDPEGPSWLSGTPPAEATPVALTRQPSALSAAASAFAGKVSVVAGEAKRAAQGLGRQATAKKGRSLRATVLVGLVLIGGIALMLFGDLELPEMLDGALPAAETNVAGSQVANAASSALPVETYEDPVTGQLLVGGLALDDAIGPVDTVPAETWTAPPVLEITSPAADQLTALEVDLALFEPSASEPTPITNSASLPATGNPTQRPTFIPYDVLPKLENPSEIRRLLERVYPSQLRTAGIEGTVILWIFVDEQGAVQKTEVKESSGYEVMDEAALSAAEKMRFAPAMNRDKATPVWLALPITFR